MDYINSNKDAAWTKIGELSRRYQVSLRTLRFYEECGLLVPFRTGAQRRYSARDEARLQLIMMGKKLGFTLRDIAKLIGVYQEHRQADPPEIFAILDPATIEEQIALLEAQRCL